ncbi:DUF86 domain-containing protein [Luteimonas sp. SJ-92]|uniref:DUF86 domain-containing protein n=1 Tax=Luteimonas salinisoli TaxID=2752307 RepID=A0A853JIZ9_9GAMM|nr:HepT-like ribonuclease domain-containing protein [Luteimonas salinisoli]NZA28360.1 DUF86 domain-containing protein [Luteimonas salinisoli]
MQRDPRAWLFDVIQAGERVQRFVSKRTYADYQADELLRAGTERQFEIIGEALNRLDRHHPDLTPSIREHQKIVGFRNVLIHGYAIVDDAVVWSTATEKLPTLLEDARKLLAALDEAAPSGDTDP